jgi:hypothetical protein
MSCNELHQGVILKTDKYTNLSLFEFITNILGIKEYYNQKIDKDDLSEMYDMIDDYNNNQYSNFENNDKHHPIEVIVQDDKVQGFFYVAYYERDACDSEFGIDLVDVYKYVKIIRKKYKIPKSGITKSDIKVVSVNWYNGCDRPDLL